MKKSGALAAALCILGNGADSLQQPSATGRASSVGARAIVEERARQLGTVGAAAALVVAAVSTVQPPAAHAVPLSPPLQAAIVETSDATYPVLQALSSSDAISPFANKVAGLLTTKIPSDKAAAALDKGIDAFLGISDSDIDAFTSIVRESYAGVTPDSCTSVKIPSEALSKLSSSNAAASVDGDKLRAADERLTRALESFPKSANSDSDAPAICLPPTREGLEKIWIGQTELSLAVPRRAAREFVSAASAAGKSIPPSEVLRILPEAKQLTKGLDGKTVKKFELTGKNLDGVLKKDPSFARLLPQ